MSKRLMVFVMLALSVCFVTAAYAEVQNVKVGGDIIVVGVSRDNVNLVGEGNATSEVNASAIASIARLRIDANLTDNVDATVRFLNERIWDTASAAGQSSDTVVIDLAYVTLKDFLNDVIGVPLTLKIGRQEIKLGSGLLIGDPDTNAVSAGNFSTIPVGDLSARKAFDGAVAVVDLDPLTITGAAIKVSEATITNTQDDDNAYALNVAYNTGVLNTTAELTYVLRDRKREAGAGADVNNYGIRLVSMPVDNLGVEAEYVYQTQKGGTAIRADGKTASDSAFRLGANYTFADVAMTPSFGLDYTRLSENWNVMFEDVTPADLMNLLFSNTNVQCFGATLGAKPTADITAKLRWAFCRLVDTIGTVLPANGNVGVNYAMDGTKKNLGNEVDLDLVYDYTSDVQFGLNLGYFKPGKAFAESNRDDASQVIGSMKVSF